MFQEKLLRETRLNSLAELPASVFPVAVLGASLVGSWHCAGMCGPVACSSGLQGQSHVYHLGRLMSYLILGLLAGSLGYTLINEQVLPFKYSAGIMMGALLCSLGINFFFGWNWPEKILKGAGRKLWNHLLPFLRKQNSQKFLLGFFTGVLPCGWLYSFVLVAAATKSPTIGALTMFAFWLGTVPALLLMSAGFRRLIRAPQTKLRQTLGVLFILAGIYSVATQFMFHN